MYQWVSSETRTAAAASLGYNLLYLLSLLLPSSVAGAVRFQHCAVRVSISVASPSPLRGRWDRVPYVSECAHFSVQVYYRRTSRFEQSCEPTDFCKAETIGSQRTTEPTRWRQKTKCEGYNKLVLEPANWRKEGTQRKTILVVTLDNLGTEISGVLWTNELSECCELWEKTVGSKRMSHEGQLSQICRSTTRHLWTGARR